MQKKKIYGAAWHLITKKTEKMFVYMRRWPYRDSADIILLKKFINNKKNLTATKKKHETKNRINIINYGNKFWFIFSAFIFFNFFFIYSKQKKKWRILPLTTFNVEVWPVTKWSITLLFFLNCLRQTGKVQRHMRHICILHNKLDEWTLPTNAK